MFECDREEFMMFIERRGCIPQSGLIKKWAESKMGFVELKIVQMEAEKEEEGCRNIMGAVVREKGWNL